MSDLKAHVLSIIDELENPPLVDDDGERLPDDAIQCTSNPSDCVMVHSWDRSVPPDAYKGGGNYKYNEDDDSWTCVDTGQVWEGFGCCYFYSDEDDLILGGTEVTSFGPMDAYYYLAKVLDIEFRVGIEGDYRSASVLVACGGTDIRVDTQSNTVRGVWGSQQVERWYTDAMGLDEAAQEIYENR